jgi:hypothetical protein
MGAKIGKSLGEESNYDNEAALIEQLSMSGYPTKHMRIFYNKQEYVRV